MYLFNSKWEEAIIKKNNIYVNFMSLQLHIFFFFNSNHMFFQYSYSLLSPWIFTNAYYIYIFKYRSANGRLYMCLIIRFIYIYIFSYNYFIMPTKNEANTLILSTLSICFFLSIFFLCTFAYADLLICLVYFVVIRVIIVLVVEDSCA